LFVLRSQKKVWQGKWKQKSFSWRRPRYESQRCMWSWRIYL